MVTSGRGHGSESAKADRRMPLESSHEERSSAPRVIERHVNLGARSHASVFPGEQAPWYPRSRMTTLEEDVESARRHFVAWMRWYLAHFEEETPSQAALARQIDVSPSAVSQLLRKGSKRKPRFEVVIGFQRLLSRAYEVPLDTLMRSDPPKVPKPG